MHKKMIAVNLAAVLIVCLTACSPVVVCDVAVPEHYLEAIESQSNGVYSSKIPLWPVCVMINEFSAETVYYTIYYFPFGTVEMSDTADDGYNLEKPLTRL